MGHKQGDKRDMKVASGMAVKLFHVRKTWTINPVERVKPSGKIYNRQKYKRFEIDA